MTILAWSALSLAVPWTAPVTDARMPTYTVDARNSGFRAVGRSRMSNDLGVVMPGVTAPLTRKAESPKYTLLFSASKYTAKRTLPVPVSFTKSTDPVRRTVSTMDEPPIPMELTVCTGIVSCNGGSGPLYGHVSAFALLRELQTSILKIARPAPQPAAAAASAATQ